MRWCKSLTRWELIGWPLRLLLLLGGGVFALLVESSVPITVGMVSILCVLIGLNVGLWWLVGMLLVNWAASDRAGRWPTFRKSSRAFAHFFLDSSGRNSSPFTVAPVSTVTFVARKRLPAFRPQSETDCPTSIFAGSVCTTRIVRFRST